MFSQADYALAAHLLGLPMPVTPAEQAAAAPMTARVLRDFADGATERDGKLTGSIRGNEIVELYRC